MKKNQIALVSSIAASCLISQFASAFTAKCSTPLFDFTMTFTVHDDWQHATLSSPILPEDIPFACNDSKTDHTAFTCETKNVTNLPSTFPFEDVLKADIKFVKEDEDTMYLYALFYGSDDQVQEGMIPCESE